MPTDVVNNQWQQIVCQRFATKSGRYEVRLTYEHPQYDILAFDPTLTTLRMTVPMVVSIGELDEARFDVSGHLKAPTIDVTFNDVMQYTGVANGASGLYTNTDVTSDLRRYSLTMLDNFFVDDTKPYYIHITRIKSNGAESIVFAGRIDPLSIVRRHNHVLKSHTTSEARQQTVTVTATALIGELLHYTVQDVVDNVSTATTFYGFGASEKIFYAGITRKAFAKHALDTPFYNIDPAVTSVYSYAAIQGASHFRPWYNTLQILAHGRTSVVTDSSGGAVTPPWWPNPTNDETTAGGAPRGTWGMSIASLLGRIAAVCNFDFTAVDDFTTPLAFAGQTMDNEATIFDSRYVRSAVTTPYELIVNYNYLLGVSPSDATAFNSPITYQRDAPLADIVRDLCLQFGCSLDVTYSSEGKPRLRLLSIRRDTGAFPTNLTLSKSEEVTRALGPDHVIVRNKGADGGVKCPASGRKQALEIVVPLRTRAFGRIAGEDTAAPTGCYLHEHIFPPAPGNLEEGDYYRLGNRYRKPAEGGLEENGWIIGSGLYERITDGATNRAYLAHWVKNPPALVAQFPDDNWDGYYQIRSVTERAGTYTDKRDNALYALAQLYAREFIGAKQVIERTYIGADDEGDTLLSIKPGMTATWLGRGGMKTYTVDRVRKSVTGHTARVTWIERPASYTALADYTVTYIDGSGNTTGTTAGTRASAGTTTLGGLVQDSGTIESRTPPLHVEVASTANLDLSGAETIDGYAVADNDLVLCRNQTTASQNGVYAVSTTGAWERFTAEAAEMRLVHVMRGTTQAGYLYELTTDGAVTVGTDSIAFALVKASDPNAVTGSGTSGRIAKFTGTTSIGNAALTDFITVSERYNTITLSVNDNSPAIEIAATVAEITAQLVATTNLDLSGSETIDSVTTTNGELVLCVAQTTTHQNGLWVVNTSGAWTRPSWDWVPVPNQRVAIRSGTLYADTIWHITNDSTPTVGTDAQTWRRYDGRAITIGGIGGATTLDKYSWPRCHVFITASTNPGYTIVLPSAADYTHGEFVIKATFAALSGTNPVTIDGPGTETIDGNAAGTPMQSAYAIRRLISDGTNWFLVG